MTLSPLPVFVVLPLATLVMLAAFLDASSRRIPNWLTLAGILSAFTVHIAISGFSGMWFALHGMSIAFALYVALYLLRALGAGDVKLMAAVGAFAGLSMWLEIFLATAAVGAAVALIQAVAKGKLFPILSSTGFVANELLHFRAPYRANAELDVKSRSAFTLPHGIAIAAGVLLTIIGRTAAM